MSTTAPPPAPARKNRRWIWYFVVVFTLAILASIGLIAFNWQQQLRPEQLEAAHKLWKDKGPPDYTMSYTNHVYGRPVGDHFWVRVRKGKVVESRYNGEPEPPERLGYRGMEGLFDDMEKFMRKDSDKSGPKTFVRAIFDRKTGALLSYVRSVMGGRERVEISVDTFTVDEPK